MLLPPKPVLPPATGDTEIRSAFSRFNPNPILALTADGQVVYSNEAANKLAADLKKPGPQSLLPLDAATLLKLCISSGENKSHVRNVVQNHTLSWSFFPIPGEDIVHCYGEDITHNINLEAQLRQAQKMDSIGQLAAGIAHDFNNLLTIIQGHSGLLLSEPNLQPNITESARQIAQAADRAATLTRQLLMFSRKQTLQPQMLNASELVKNISKMLRTLVGEHIQYRHELAAEAPPVYADPGMLEQVLVNLVVNARDAMGKGGTLVIRVAGKRADQPFNTTTGEAPAGCYLSMSVTDTGHGMDESTRAQIFEPFFTTKSIGEGTGLGLATVLSIVKQHQGFVDVSSEVGTGSTFEVLIPATVKELTSSAETHQTEARRGTETILLVEDEPALRDLVAEILEQKGYVVLAAANGQEALRHWETAKGQIVLLLTDLLLPNGLSGDELAARLVAEKPDLKVIYTTGYSPDMIGIDLALNEGVNFLQKPYQPQALGRIVRECLDAVEYA